MRNLPKGFTLIELLVVIAVLGVLAAGVWVALNPLDRIRSANDAKVQSDIGSLAQAEEAYATSRQGYYAVDQAALVGNGDLKATLTEPTGYTYNITALPAACVSGTSCTSVRISSTLLSKKYTATPAWVYCSTSGKAGATATETTCP